MLKHLLACVLVASPLAAGASRAADAGWEERHGLTAEEFEKAAREFAEKGYRPVQVGAVAVGKEVRFLGLWEKASKDDPARESRHDLTAKQFEKVAAELKEKGFRPVEISGCESGGEARFAAVWEKEPKDAPPREVRPALTSDEFRKLYTELTNKGYRPLRLNGYAVGKETYYATVWEKTPKGGPAWHARRDLTADQYQDVFAEQAKSGLRLVHVSGYTIDGQERFAGVWVKSAGPTWYGHHAMDAKQYEAALTDYKTKGFRPTQVSGYAIGGKPRFAAIWVKDS